MHTVNWKSNLLSGFKALQVAENQADAYIHVTLIKKWDICAGDALLHALGGKMTTLDGNSIDYGDPNIVKNEKGLIATTHDHEKFVQKLASLASWFNVSENKRLFVECGSF